MRYQILTIGTLKRRFYKEGCAFYAERLQKYAKVELNELKEAKSRDASQVQTLESNALSNAARGYVIVLDEKGKTFDSEDLAQHLTALENRSIGLINLLIGGAEGHSESLKKEADERWRLSNLTLPHDLARLVLLEQLYRAETIRAGHPYHRGQGSGVKIL